MELSFEGIHKRRPLHGGEEGQPKADTCGQWGKGVRGKCGHVRRIIYMEFHVHFWELSGFLTLTVEVQML